jgi:hypothetical protein
MTVERRGPPGLSPPPSAVDAPVDRERLILVADPNIESGKVLLSALAGLGLQLTPRARGTGVSFTSGY